MDSPHADSSLYETILVPVPGLKASSFNRAIFPLSSYRKRDCLGLGDLYLDATLDEMVKISKFGIDHQILQQIIITMRSRYDRLLERRSELEQRPKSINPIKTLTNYRAARLFLSASKSLYHITKSRSDDLLRERTRKMLSIVVEDLQPAEGDVPVDSSLGGIAVKVKRPCDDTAKQQILNAANAIASYSSLFESDQSMADTSSFLSDEYVLAAESLSSLISSDTEEIPDDTISPLPSSPIINNYYSFRNSVYSPNSIVQGTTVNHSGRGSSNSGSVIHTITPSDGT